LDCRQPLAVSRHAILNSNLPKSCWRPSQNGRFLTVLNTSICSLPSAVRKCKQINQHLRQLKFA
jgi:hypothetical protein